MKPEQDILLEALYKEQYRNLFRYAVSELKHKGFAEEIVQDTFLEAIKKIDDLMKHPNQTGWLMETVKNKIKTYKRHQVRYLKLFLSLDSGVAREPAREDNRIKALEGIDLDGMRRYLNEEEIYQLKRVFFDRASHLEVSQELGISLWACQKRMERIKGKLKQNDAV